MTEAARKKDEEVEAGETTGASTSSPSAGEEEQSASDSDDKADDKAEKEERVVPRGNPLRRARGGITAGAAGLLAFVLMAHNGQLRWGVPLGVLCCLVAAWGVMDVLGTF